MWAVIGHGRRPALDSQRRLLSDEVPVAVVGWNACRFARTADQRVAIGLQCACNLSDAVSAGLHADRRRVPAGCPMTPAIASTPRDARTPSFERRRKRTREPRQLCPGTHRGRCVECVSLRVQDSTHHRPDPCFGRGNDAPGTHRGPGASQPRRCARRCCYLGWRWLALGHERLATPPAPAHRASRPLCPRSFFRRVPPVVSPGGAVVVGSVVLTPLDESEHRESQRAHSTATAVKATPTPPRPAAMPAARRQESVTATPPRPAAQTAPHRPPEQTTTSRSPTPPPAWALAGPGPADNQTC